MRKKLAIYPFFEELMPVLQYKNKIRDYELVYAITPTGWESFSESGEFSEYICSEERFYSENLIHSIDIFLLCLPMFQINSSIYHRIITLAEQYGKQIIYEIELEPIIKELFKGQGICLNPELSDITPSTEIVSIDVPVIMILGLGENCEKWRIQLDLRDFFHLKGYRASLISSNPISQLLGFHTLPSSLDNKGLIFSQQVQNLNSFIKKIELKEKPDVIILGVPGGILKYSNSVPNGYGYLPFLISNAVTPDLSILSLYGGNYTEQNIQEIKSTCYYRFGVVVNYFHISKKICDYNFETKRINYYSVDNSYLVENIVKPQQNKNTFNISDSTSTQMVFEMIIQELQNNVAAV
ncbi:TIGR04066 family peptide maturation system protein [Paenibacillus oralis]|uniref:TIGR04066 family peptide maturation system protein n=1 Tax=Paenibacillus oralis TaxID=2490856 RepID=A0A3P3U9S6_9BACL|nr:TIGR04066 family peptide maturation system protein [Paenibacillus oralis]RRJ67111.1 TIGR04066 family peptide maturation system protein [Paenibacillus oralis]